MNDSNIAVQSTSLSPESLRRVAGKAPRCLTLSQIILKYFARLLFKA